MVGTVSVNESGQTGLCGNGNGNGNGNGRHQSRVLFSYRHIGAKGFTQVTAAEAAKDPEFMKAFRGTKEGDLVGFGRMLPLEEGQKSRRIIWSHVEVGPVGADQPSRS